MKLDIRLITAADTYPLRHAILRPSEPLSAVVFPLDSSSLHFGAFDGEELLGVATVHREEKADFSFPLQYRLRGMAVAKNAQGRGVGKAIVFETLKHLQRGEVPFLWCNAREIAIPFYERLGFFIHGDFFEIPGVGPHKVMFRETK